jgi:hypothetical protein
LKSAKHAILHFRPNFSAFKVVTHRRFPILKA